MNKTSLPDFIVSEQLTLEKPNSNSDIKEDYYVGYYQGEEGAIIYCKLTLSEQTEQAQIDLIYWEDANEYSEYTYPGTIIYQQNGMSLFFRNEDTILDRSQFIGIHCERQIKVKPFLVGTISGYDRDRRPVVGEVIFQRVNSKEELKSITQNKQVNSIIAQYLSGRRWIINNKMIQNLLELSPQSKHAPIIEKFIRSYKGVFVAIEHGFFIIELTIKDNTGAAVFNIAGHPLYQGIIKVQASGQLLIGNFINIITQAPLFLSIEVLAVRDKLFRGDLMGISKFDKSFSGNIFLSSGQKLINQLPKYRASELTREEINALPKEILIELGHILKNNRLEKYLRNADDTLLSAGIQYLEGNYLIVSVRDRIKQDDAHLHISKDGKTKLTHKHLIYEGKTMMSEGGVISTYFTSCNGIPHCGQIVGKIGRGSRKDLTDFDATWHTMDEDFNPKSISVIVSPA